MFNFLVSYSGWAPNNDTISRSRAFEYTETSLSTRFRKDRNAIDPIVMTFPTLFVTESGGSGPQYARVGSIISVRADGDDYQLEYVFDNEIAPIPNSKLEELGKTLGISDTFEFTRTHWAIKDVDLYRILARMLSATKPRPEVFRLPDAPVEDDLVSVMMPFDGSFNRVYSAIQSAATNDGMRCQRADDIWEDDVIIQDVVSLIYRSAVVICDLSGKNPNVFYEAGIAHTLGKKVILIAQHDSDIPFDLRHIRHIKYLNNDQGVETLGSRVETRLNQLTT